MYGTVYRVVQDPTIVGQRLDCKTVRIFAYLSTRALPISLLILRKKPTVLQSSQRLLDHAKIHRWLDVSMFFTNTFQSRWVLNDFK